MRITADRKKGWLTAGENHYAISNNVRTLKEGTRASHEVIYSIPGCFPYDPHPFPSGVWKITGLDWQKEKNFDPRTYGQVKIKTDAHQAVRVWDLDDENDYLRETEKETNDSAYWLHYSIYQTTLGCIRVIREQDAVDLANIIKAAIDSGEQVELEVI
jgi:hypothetical protein